MGTDISVTGPDRPNSWGTNGAELAHLVRLGMTPLQAIEAATATAPLTLGPQAPRSGRLESGYDADMITVAANPLADIAVLGRPGQIAHAWCDRVGGPHQVSGSGHQASSIEGSAGDCTVIRSAVRRAPCPGQLFSISLSTSSVDHPGVRQLPGQRQVRRPPGALPRRQRMRARPVRSSDPFGYPGGTRRGPPSRSSRPPCVRGGHVPDGTAIGQPRHTLRQEGRRSRCRSGSGIRVCARCWAGRRAGGPSYLSLSMPSLTETGHRRIALINATPIGRGHRHHASTSWWSPATTPT